MYMKTERRNGEEEKKSENENIDMGLGGVVTGSIFDVWIQNSIQST